MKRYEKTIYARFAANLDICFESETTKREFDSSNLAPNLSNFNRGNSSGMVHALVIQGLN